MIKNTLYEVFRKLSQKKKEKLWNNSLFPTYCTTKLVLLQLPISISEFYFYIILMHASVLFVCACMCVHMLCVCFYSCSDVFRHTYVSSMLGVVGNFRNVFASLNTRQGVPKVPWSISLTLVLWLKYVSLFLTFSCAYWGFNKGTQCYEART